ncbi:MAG: rod shape-determining protein MreC [Planctomycetota bacterium]
MALALAVALTVPPPAALRPWVEEFRSRAALLFSRPAEAITTRLHPEDREETAGDPVEVDLDAPGIDEGIAVVWASEADHTLVIGAGWAEGLDRGQVVCEGDRFLGFVDRVEEHLARVRLAGHETSRFGVLLVDDEGEIRQRLLVVGDGHRHARPAGGRLVESGSVGALARRPGAAGLVVGRVVARDGEAAIEVARADQVGDRVHVLDPNDDRPIDARPARLFASLSAAPRAPGASGPARDAVILPFGLAEGLGPGDAVTRSGRIVGRVAAVGRHTARAVPAVAFKPETILVEDEDREPRRVTRGRGGPGALPLPRGLLPVEGDDPAADLRRDEDEAPGELVVHVFVHRESFARLVRGIG